MTSEIRGESEDSETGKEKKLKKGCLGELVTTVYPFSLRTTEESCRPSLRIVSQEDNR